MSEGGENKSVPFFPLVVSSQLIGVLTAAAQGKSDGESLQTAAWVAGSATQYNYLLHEELAERKEKVKGCGRDEACRQETLRYYADLDQTRNDSLPGFCQSNPDQCMGVMRRLASERRLNEAAMDRLRFEDVNAAIGIQLAVESNEAAIDTIQLELIRHRYGEGTAVAFEVVQLAAAGGLGKRLISAVGRLGKGGAQRATGEEPSLGGQVGGRGVASRTAEVPGGATTGADGAEVVANTGTFPDEIFTGKKPHQTMPGTKSVTQERYNSATGKLEKSLIEYDEYGRQVKRTDFTNHGYGDKTKPAEYHSDPHMHTYEYGPGYGAKGKETRVNNE